MGQSAPPKRYRECLGLGGREDALPPYGTCMHVHVHIGLTGYRVGVGQSFPPAPSLFPETVSSSALAYFREIFQEIL